ncbi:uncharacterized protein K02A2.6-like [Macrobrachium nipponense]|uniref:uncharacterized protein K02A2.6-like n=1 Tax=Macrobrachium nipponense TaxID=159736 RepID=UPI0030C84897
MCQQYRHCAIDKQPLHPWKFPSKPWSLIHIDYAGPIEGQMFLVVIDAYSKWLEVVPTQGYTSKVTVSKLRHIFCTHGLPDVIVSDNATAFVSEEFQSFVNKNGIRHVTSAPYHPSTNGLAENAVKTFKTALKKCEGRSQARNYKGNRGRVAEKFEEGDHVYFRNYSRAGPPNSPGIVEECTGPISCKIVSSDGDVVHRHFDQMFKQVKPSCEIEGNVNFKGNANFKAGDNFKVANEGHFSHL